MNIPILMLHHISDAPHHSLAHWCISELKFMLLLDIIVKKGLETTTFEAIRNTKKQKNNKQIILTFDDCPAQLFDFAVPELIKRNMKAVFFIPTAQIGGYNKWDVDEQGFEKIELMNAQQLRYLSANGMEIGSHGQNHLRASDISNKDYFKRISSSKTFLEQVLSKRVYSFAYPYGELPGNYRKLLKKAGYAYGLSIYRSFPNQHSLRRIGIHQTDDQKSISFKLSKSYRLLRFLTDPLLWVIKKVRSRKSRVRSLDAYLKTND